METSVNVYADRHNQVSLYAVQGEKGSRNVVFNIIEQSGEIMPNSNATIVNKMLDLTGYTCAFYVVKPNEEFVSANCIIVDAIKGIMSVTLTGQMLSTACEAECVIALTKTNQELRIVGIKLTIDSSNLNEGES